MRTIKDESNSTLSNVVTLLINNLNNKYGYVMLSYQVHLQYASTGIDYAMGISSQLHW